MTLTVGSLFAGIGGFDLAAEWMGWRTIWVSEIDPYACKVLAHRFPGAPNLGDITKIKWGLVERPDILCGGFPCQPHSVAGLRKAGEDERDLWGECARAVRDLRPDYAVFENVTGLLTSDAGRFFNRVMSDLARLGYDAEWSVLSASAVGAPHERERIWIVAYPAETGTEGGHPSRGRSVQHRGGGGRTPLGDADSPRLEGQRDVRECPREWAAWANGEVRVGRDGKARLCPPRVPLVAYGIPSAVERIGSTGNAIVPQCAVAGPFRRIAELEGLA